jgi:GNAT superfamily N-acetyltransferase
VQAGFALNDEFAAEVTHYEALTLTTAPAVCEARMGHWLLRASRSSTMRSNSATWLGQRGTPLASATLDEIEAWYAANEQAPAFRTNEIITPQGTSAELASRGYTAAGGTVLMTLASDRMLALGTSAIPLAGNWLPLSVQDGMRQVGVWKGLPPDEVAREASRQTRFQGIERMCGVEIDGAVCCVGLARVLGHDVGVFNVHTRSDVRGKGLARALVVNQLRWARGQGAERAFLQVDLANAAAIRLYVQLGFSVLYEYQTWVRPVLKR